MTQLAKKVMSNWPLNGNHGDDTSHNKTEIDTPVVEKHHCNSNINII